MSQFIRNFCQQSVKRYCNHYHKQGARVPPAERNIHQIQEKDDDYAHEYCKYEELRCW